MDIEVNHDKENERFVAEVKGDKAYLSYNIINDKTIEKNLHKDYELIVLPGSKSLSDKEIINSWIFKSVE